MGEASRRGSFQKRKDQSIIDMQERKRLDDWFLSRQSYAEKKSLTIYSRFLQLLIAAGVFYD